MRVREDGNKRDRLLRQGRLQIVSFLNDLPKTEVSTNSEILHVQALGNLWLKTV